MLHCKAMHLFCLLSKRSTDLDRLMQKKNTNLHLEPDIQNAYTYAHIYTHIHAYTLTIYQSYNLPTSKLFSPLYPTVIVSECQC